MILEVKKINDQFVIKNPPINSGEQFFLQIEKKHILKSRPGKKKMPQTDITFQELKALALKLSDDVLLQNMVKYYKPHISNQKSDDDVYHEYLMERYGK